MGRKTWMAGALAATSLGGVAWLAGLPTTQTGAGDPSPSSDDAPLPSEAEQRAMREARRREALEATLTADYPLHGLVTAPQIAVRAEPEREAAVIGWLRLGGRPRLRPEPRPTPTCATGWYALYPSGWACAGLGITVAETAPPSTDTASAADIDGPLPYRYLRVREPQVAEYHQPPSREVQRAATAHGRRYAELLNEGREQRAERLRSSGIPGEPARPAAVARYLHRNFYVAGTGVHVRASRRFVRTVRGSYVQEAQLIDTTGSEFEGITLDEDHGLPVAWTVRDAQPLERLVRRDGTSRLRRDPELEPIGRQARIEWLRREQINGRDYHAFRTEEGEERYLRQWFVALAESLEAPEGLDDDEPWVHVDISEQTLVVYRGAQPIYATLVSTGLEGHDTPRGEFRIRRKLISDTMANVGPDAGEDSYRIDDVPWTQYFRGSFAIHGAFWHHRFGLRRSHGCVNLAPRDARWVFEHTWPEIPRGWHGVSTDRPSEQRGSRVIVTD